MIKSSRKGAIGALLGEYEKAIQALSTLLLTIPDAFLIIISDPETSDENCRSVQTILSHVISSGYGYAISIHNIKGSHRDRPAKTFHLTIEQYQEDLKHLFSFTQNVFATIQDHELEEFNPSLKIHSAWGQLYDIEQMIEHAIVHVLRHRRQIEQIVLLYCSPRKNVQ